MSAKARSPDEAASWLRLAEDLLRLAEDFEKLRQKRLLSQRLRRQRALERRPAKLDA
jgi:hypothetical protein